MEIQALVHLLSRFFFLPNRLLLSDLQDKDSIDFPVRFPQAYDEIVASTDGLLLLKSFLVHTETRLCVHNPVTGSKKKLPLNPSHIDHNGSCSYWIVHDASIQKYKVVVFIDHDGDLNVQNEMGIITVDNDGDKGWRKLISPSAFCLGCAFQVITVNGILHWLAFTSDIMNCPFNPDLEVAFVQSMDIAKEEFRQGISLPCQPKIDYDDYPYVQLTNCKLLEMKGSIYFSKPATDTELELWMLEDLDNHIWAMKHKICLLSIVDKPNGLASFLVSDSFYPIQMIGNHRLMIFVEDSNSPYFNQMRWYLYDLRSHELKAIVSRSAEAKRCYFYSCLQITHVKSLVSWNILENWNGVIIASNLAYFLKPAALCYPEAFTSLCPRHDLIKRFAFECIGRVLQIFHGLANCGKYEESLLLEAEELVDNLKSARVDVDWLEERLSIQREMMATKDEMTKYGALLKATQDKYNRLQDRYSEIETEVLSVPGLELGRAEQIQTLTPPIM
ncbi:uncharacterized protein LOC132293479 [Cornus florida]|uniref:uncharacterized protein LOC132293479 n=1 Tax=Cornus florida TaxID=4283 RepID=UPI0028982910|nr:uncharacterized protein LOC132293479 [Cornus florida]